MSAKARRYVAGAAAGAALTVSLAGCGGSGADKASGDSGMRLTAAQQALGRTSQKTADVTSFRAKLSNSTVVAGRQTQMNGDLAVKLKPQPAMRLDIPTITTAGKQTPGMQEILVGDAIYLKSPALAKQAGKPWVKFSLSKLGEATGVDVKSLENQGKQADPSLNAKMLAASKDVRVVGKETVDGVPTTHYRGTFSLSDALARLGTQDRAEAQKVFGQLGLDKLLFNAWVDGQQLPRKITLATPPGAKLQMNTTMDYTAFNVPVSITPPPASQVKDGSVPSGAPSSPSTPG